MLAGHRGARELSRRRVDYQVAIDGTDVVLRVTGAAPARSRPGDAVALTVPVSACVPLPATDDPGPSDAGRGPT